VAARVELVAEALRGLERARGLGRVGAGDRRGHGDRAGRDDEAIERLRVLAVAGAHGELARVEVDRDDLGPGADVDAVLAVLLGRAHDELAQLLDDLADVVGDPARRVRGVRAALEGHQVERLVAAARARRRAHARRVAAHDRQPVAHASGAYP
jgi:hypothetical protein